MNTVFFGGRGSGLGNPGIIWFFEWSNNYSDFGTSILKKIIRNVGLKLWRFDVGGLRIHVVYTLEIPPTQ